MTSQASDNSVSDNRVTPLRCIISAILGLVAFLVSFVTLTLVVVYLTWLFSIPNIFGDTNLFLAAVAGVYAFYKIFIIYPYKRHYLNAWFLSGWLAFLISGLVFLVCNFVIPSIMLSYSESSLEFIFVLSILIAGFSGYLCVIKIYQLYPNLTYTKVSPYLIGFGVLGSLNAFLAFSTTGIGWYMACVTLLYPLLTVAKFSEWEEIKNTSQNE